MAEPEKDPTDPDEILAMQVNQLKIGTEGVPKCAGVVAGAAAASTTGLFRGLRRLREHAVETFSSKDKD